MVRKSQRTHPLQASALESAGVEVEEAASPQPAGLRERHKRDKLLRIQAAARTVFVTKGFEGATTREIAQIADVSHATIFLYAKDKRDLLFLVFNEDMDRVVADAVAAARPAGSLVDRLTRWYTPFLQYFSAEIPIGLIAMHERSMVAAAESPTGPGLSVRRRGEQAKRELLALIDGAITSGELDSQLDRTLAFRVIRSVFYAELERWLSTRPHPSLEQGLHDLRAALELLVRGLKHRP